MSLVVISIMNNVIRGPCKEVARLQMRGIVQETMIEAQFIKMFNHDMMRNMVVETVADTLNEALYQDECRYL